MYAHFLFFNGSYKNQNSAYAGKVTKGKIKQVSLMLNHII